MTAGFFFNSCQNYLSDDSSDSFEMAFNHQNIQLKINEMEALQLIITKINNYPWVVWNVSDSNVIAAKNDFFGSVITGLAPGKSTITAFCKGKICSCTVTVSDEIYEPEITNPYVYSSTDIVSIERGKTERISAALYGGTIADINGFSWSVDKPGIASISTDGNYCWITGVNTGTARITISHTKAVYSYSVLVNVGESIKDIAYLSTADNIVTINTEKNVESYNIKINFNNFSGSDYRSKLDYYLMDSNGNRITTDAIVSINFASEGYFKLTALRNGECYLRVTHPEAEYALDILVRVITSTLNPYIKLSENMVTLSGTDHTVNANIIDYNGLIDPDLFQWTFTDGAAEFISWDLIGGSDSQHGSSIRLFGLKSGTVKITVSYPEMTSRNLIVVIKDIENEAADSKCYITTSQNYVSLKTNNEPYQLKVLLENCKLNDFNDVKWSIVNEAADGTSASVIKWSEGNGYSISSSSRAAISYSEEADCTILPLQAGIAYIDITHPRAVYPTRITVKVSEPSEDDNKCILYKNSSNAPVYYMKNDFEEYTMTVNLDGNGKEDEIIWNIAESGWESYLDLSKNGNKCSLKTKGASGLSKFTLLASHKNAEYPVTFYIVVYDNEEEKNSMKIPVLYSSQSYSSVKYLENQTIRVNSTEDISIKWSIISGADNIDLKNETKDSVSVYGKKVGLAVIKAYDEKYNTSLFVTVRIYNPYVTDSSEKYGFLTTFSNVLYFDSSKSDAQVLITDAKNIESYACVNFTEYEIKETEGNCCFDIIQNGNYFTVKPLKDHGEAIMTIKNKYCENILSVYLKVGEQYSYKNDDLIYITTSVDTMEFLVGDSLDSFVAKLNHTNASDNKDYDKGFIFESEDNEVVQVYSDSLSNNCVVKPCKEGISVIHVSHPDAVDINGKKLVKDVIVIVKQSDNATVPYITTKDNVMNLVQGDFSPITCSLKNISTINDDNWTWESSDEKIVSISARNGNTAMICGNNPGVANITVRHSSCIYGLKIIAVVNSNPVETAQYYINLSDKILSMADYEETSITASIIGSTSSTDDNYFNWSCSNPEILSISGSGSKCRIQAMKGGVATVSVTNSRYPFAYTRTCLVQVKENTSASTYIKSSDMIVNLSPTSKTGKTLTAELFNGEETDAMNFSWYADDPKLLNITSNNEVCKIEPTGISGTTYLHITHPKAVKNCDILVKISNYSEFNFSSDSVQVYPGRMKFISMQVPAIKEPYYIDYSSSDESICGVYGSALVATLVSQATGTVTVKAAMKSRNTNEVISTCEMLAYVVPVDNRIPVISLDQYIYTIKDGDNLIPSASLSGFNYTDGEENDLIWWIDDFEEQNEILDMYNFSRLSFEIKEVESYKNEGRLYPKGSTIMLTATENAASMKGKNMTSQDMEITGEYVLHVKHPKSGAETSAIIKVVEKQSTYIEITDNLKLINKDDGAFEVKANIINGTSKDERSVVWTVSKSFGTNIVSIQKTNGTICNVIPKTTGSCVLTATLPNGTYDTCVITVKNPVSIEFAYDSVSVFPDETLEVPFTLVPSNLDVQFVDEQAPKDITNLELTPYYSFKVDMGRKVLCITGKSPAENSVAGTITAYSVSAAGAYNASISVYVDSGMTAQAYRYYIDPKSEGNNPNDYMRCDTLKSIEPENPDIEDNPFMVDFYPGSTEKVEYEFIINKIYPADRPAVRIDVLKEFTYQDSKLRKWRRLICNAVPLIEGESEIDLKIMLKSSGKNIVFNLSDIQQQINYKSYYKNYSFELTPTANNVGAYSRWHETNGIINGLTLCDGESLGAKFEILNKKASGKISNIEFRSSVTNPDYKTELDSVNIKNIDKESTVEELNFLPRTPNRNSFSYNGEKEKAIAELFGWTLGNDQELPCDPAFSEVLDNDKLIYEIWTYKTTRHHNATQSLLRLNLNKDADSSNTSKSFLFSHLWDYHKDIPRVPKNLEDFKEQQNKHLPSESKILEDSELKQIMAKYCSEAGKKTTDVDANNNNEATWTVEIKYSDYGVEDLEGLLKQFGDKTPEQLQEEFPKIFGLMEFVSEIDFGDIREYTTKGAEGYGTGNGQWWPVTRKFQASLSYTYLDKSDNNSISESGWYYILKHSTSTDTNKVEITKKNAKDINISEFDNPYPHVDYFPSSSKTKLNPSTITKTLSSDYSQIVAKEVDFLLFANDLYAAAEECFSDNSDKLKALRESGTINTDDFWNFLKAEHEKTRYDFNTQTNQTISTTEKFHYLSSNLKEIKNSPFINSPYFWAFYTIKDISEAKNENEVFNLKPTLTVNISADIKINLRDFIKDVVSFRCKYNEKYNSLMDSIQSYNFFDEVPAWYVNSHFKSGNIHTVPLDKNDIETGFIYTQTMANTGKQLDNQAISAGVGLATKTAGIGGMYLAATAAGLVFPPIGLAGAALTYFSDSIQDSFQSFMGGYKEQYTFNVVKTSKGDILRENLTSIIGYHKTWNRNQNLIIGKAPLEINWTNHSYYTTNTKNNDNGYVLRGGDFYMNPDFVSTPTSCYADSSYKKRMGGSLKDISEETTFYLRGINKTYEMPVFDIEYTVINENKDEKHIMHNDVSQNREIKVSPTLSKDDTVIFNNSNKPIGKLVITYEKPDESEETKEIPVYFELRNNEAYSKGLWDYERCSHYMGIERNLDKWYPKK